MCACVRACHSCSLEYCHSLFSAALASAGAGDVVPFSVVAGVLSSSAISSTSNGSGSGSFLKKRSGSMGRVSPEEK